MRSHSRCYIPYPTTDSLPTSLKVLNDRPQSYHFLSLYTRQFSLIDNSDSLHCYSFEFSASTCSTYIPSSDFDPVIRKTSLVDSHPHMRRIHLCPINLTAPNPIYSSFYVCKANKLPKHPLLFEVVAGFLCAYSRQLGRGRAAAVTLRHSLGFSGDAAVCRLAESAVTDWIGACSD